MADGAPAPGLRALLNDIAREQRYHNHQVAVTPISTGGANYTSELFLVTITAPGKEDLRLFVKQANINGKMREDAPITKFYETERFVYGTLVGVYRALEERSGVPAEHRLCFPQYFGCNPALFEETIVLEDLSAPARGLGAHDRLRSVDWPYAAAAVTELAKLHALSFAFEHDAPEEFARVIKERTFEFGSEEKMKVVWEGMVRGAVGACREEHRARLGRYLAEQAPRVRDYYRPLRRAVLTHGDFRPSNLMHKVKQDGSLEVVAVDYQTLRAGRAPTDLLYLVFAGSDAAFRSRHYARLVEEYYAQLQQALRRLHLDPDQVYPREDFDYELKESLPYGLFISVFVLPLVTVEAADAPRIDDLTENWNVATSTLFAERLSGIVDDYVAWGVL